MRPAAKGCFSGIGVGMWQKHVSYMWFGLREGVITPATRKRFRSQHRTAGSTQRAARPKSLPNERYPKRISNETAEGALPRALSPRQGGRSTNNPSGTVRSGRQPILSCWTAAIHVATAGNKASGRFGVLRAAGMSVQKHPPRLSGFCAIASPRQNNYTLTQLEPTHHMAVSRLAPGGDGMTLLMKKVAGLGLMLLGGLTVAHGGSAGQMWEVLVGLLVIMIGAVLLAMKVLHRNMPQAGQPDR